MPLTDEQGSEVQALYDALIEDDDVEEVYTNAQWPSMASEDTEDDQHATT
jgi:transcriptional/translational regulatory protein YebC/TACO1